MKLATLCYVRRGDTTLMIHRIKKDNDIHQGKWNGLGGKMEPGESPEECATREVQEESGLIALKLIFKGILSFPSFSAEEDWYAFVYVVDEFEGQLIDSPEGNLRWVDNNRILELNLWEGDLFFLPLLEKPGIFSGKFVYKDGRLSDYKMVCYP